MIRLSVQELGRLQFSIDRQLKVPIFTFFGGKGVKFQIVKISVAVYFVSEETIKHAVLPVNIVSGANFLSAPRDRQYIRLFLLQHCKLAPGV